MISQPFPVSYSSLSVEAFVKKFGIRKDPSGAFLLDPGRVLPFAANPHEKLRQIPELAMSIEESGRQEQPGSVRFIDNHPTHYAMLVDGARRHAAVSLLRKTDKKWFFRAFPETTIKNQVEHLRHSFAANYGRDGHNCIETAHTVKGLLEAGDTVTSIARLAGGKSTTWVIQHNSLNKLAPEVQDMLTADANDDSRGVGHRLTFSIALTLVDLPHKDQIREAHRIIDEKMTMTKARRHVKSVLRINAAALGQHVEVSKPRRMFLGLLSFSETLGDTLGRYSDMTMVELEQVFATATPGSSQLLQDRLERFDADLRTFIGTVKAFNRKR